MNWGQERETHASRVGQGRCGVNFVRSGSGSEIAKENGDTLRGVANVCMRTPAMIVIQDKKKTAKNDIR